MFEQERWEAILDLLKSHDFLTVDELVPTLGASPATIRRDIIKLAKSGLLTKVHGGIKPVPIEQESHLNQNDSSESKYIFSSSDPYFEQEMEEHRDKKLQIAKKAASLIEDDDCVFIGTGSTTYYMIDFITARNVTVISNSIFHLRKLVANNFSVYIPEGELNLEHQFITLSDDALNRLTEINIRKTFLGSRGIDLDYGFSTSSLLIYRAKRKLINLPARHYILADSSKYGNNYFITFAKAEEATLITDSVPPEYRERYRYILADSDINT